MILPINVTSDSVGHIAHHNQIHTRLNNEYVDVVADFGAAGDNSTDDSAAINAAIEEAHGGPGAVAFPGGRSYRIGSTIEWRAGVALVGLGKAKTTNTRSKPALIWSGSAGGTVIEAEDVGDNIYNTPITNLEVDGNDVAATGIVYPNEVDSGTYIWDCVIRRLTANGVEYQDGATNGLIGGGTRFDHIGEYAVLLNIGVFSVMELSDVEFDNGLAVGSGAKGFLRVVAASSQSGAAIHIGRCRIEVNQNLGGNKAVIEFDNNADFNSGVQLRLSGHNVDVGGPSSVANEGVTFFRPVTEADKTFSLAFINSRLGFFASPTVSNVASPPPYNLKNSYPLFVYAPFDFGSPGAGNFLSVFHSRTNLRNLEVGGVGAEKSNSGHGDGVILIANAGVVPSAQPAGAGILYVEDGALKYRGTSGSVTTIANA